MKFGDVFRWHVKGHITVPPGQDVVTAMYIGPADGGLVVVLQDSGVGSWAPGWVKNGLDSIQRDQIEMLDEGVR